jgi:hypothetical protein
MKNLNLYGFVLVCCCALFFSSCKELIEPSIAKRTVRLNAPADGYESAKYLVGFWWDDVEDALQYRFQIVSGTFDTPGQLVADTLVWGNKFTISMEPGEYQWRVRAENGSSATGFSATRSVTVLASSIKGQSVRLLSPADGTLSNLAKMNFTWDKLFGATKYRLQVDTNFFADESSLVYDGTAAGLSYTLPIAKDQRYQWRVMAENDTAEARWSALRAVTIDRTPPDKPEPQYPANRGSVNTPVNLRWSSAEGAAAYRLVVLKADSVSVYDRTYPVDTKSNSYSFNAGIPGEQVVWKVFSVDAAGNVSGPGKIFSFNVQ